MSKKTFIIKFPQLNIDLIQHFIRGYFDGDGSISINKSGISLNFTCGNHLFLEKISTYMIKKKIYDRKNFSTLDYNKYSDIEKIYYYLYNNSNIYLERKKEKIEYLINNKEKIFSEINKNRRLKYNKNKEMINEKRRLKYKIKKYENKHE